MLQDNLPKQNALCIIDVSQIAHLNINIKDAPIEKKKDLEVKCLMAFLVGPTPIKSIKDSGKSCSSKQQQKRNYLTCMFKF